MEKIEEDQGKNGQVELNPVEVSSAEVGKDLKLGKQVVTSNFQIADVRTPLLAVERNVKRGNIVQFGDLPGESFILNKESGRKLMLHKRGKGSYALRGSS